MAITKQPFVSPQTARTAIGKPKYNAESLRQALLRFHREPFVDLLAEWLQNAPSTEAIQSFAEEYPDRYVSALTQLARLGGFTEKRELDVTHHMLVKEMSDSQLEDRLANLQKQLELTAAEVLTEEAQLSPPEESRTVESVENLDSQESDAKNS